ncbi:YceI family protein [Pseudidiomarina salinarum]|nr:YceI family protein [Pseudidiomarina salinarum]
MMSLIRLMIPSVVIFSASLFLSSPAQAELEWKLDENRSVLNFVSVKNDHVAELHRFNELKGELLGEELTIQIPVKSLDTQIAIRDERMREHLFNAKEHPFITAKATIPHSSITDIPVLTTVPLEVDFKVFIAGEAQRVNSVVQITRLDVERFLATTAQPVLISTKDFKLVEGVNRLREIANLEAIDYVVPVTFSVQFERQPPQ